MTDEADVDLFGGQGAAPELRLETWRAHDAELAATSFRRMLARLPALAVHALRLAWQASRVDTAVTCGLQLASGALTAFGLLATRGVLQALFASGPTPERVRAALPAVALVAAATSVQAALQAAAGWAQARLSPAVDTLVETRLVEVTSRVELAAFDDAEFFASMQRARDRGAMSVPQVVDAVVDTGTSVVGLVAAAGTLTVLHPLLLPLLVVTALPPGWAAVRSARMRYVSIHQRTAIRRRKWILSDLLAARETATDLRAYTMRRYLLGQYSRICARELDADLAIARRQTATRVAGAAIAGTATAAVYLTLGALLVSGHMPLATAGTAVLAIQTGQSDLNYLVLAVNRMYEEGLYFTDYLTFLTDAATRTPTGTTPAPPRFDRITLDDVTFTYPGTDRPAVHRISLTIHAGQIIALVGENGSGKTTLAKLVAGLYHPDTGTVHWDDTDIGTCDPESLWSRITVVTQDYARWPFTARANITLGTEPDHPDHLRDAAHAAGAHQVVDTLPHGYDTLLDRTFTTGVDLSGGQWQRLAVARGYYRHTPLLICDEPTAALDARAEHALYSQLPHLAAGRTVVLITHRLASVRHADHIYVLHNGQIEEHGTHEQLLANPGRYADLYTLQASSYTSPATPSPIAHQQ